MNSIAMMTASGPIRGRRISGINVFKGIPFAKPPIGNLRFAPPECAEPWIEPLDCVNFGPTAIQEGHRVGLPMSEDCLTLNVWAPAEGSKMPVFIYIHGGGFNAGCNAETNMDGMCFAKDGVVMVTINYRLNVLGFFASQQTLDLYGTTGNWGLLDQIKALEWVNANIALFGGDPHNVTVGGGSAGAYSVTALMLSPLAKGLFQKTALQSGDILSIASFSYYARGHLERSIAASEQMFSRIFGVSDNAEGLCKLRAVNPRIFPHMVPTSPHILALYPYECLPLFDGFVLPKDPVKALTNGDFNKVKMIFGYSADEGAVFVPLGLNEHQYQMFAIELFGHERAETFLQRFPVDSRHTASRRTRDMLAFAMFNAGMVLLGDAYSQIGLDVYAYRFDYVRLQDQKPETGAEHCSDMAYIFNNLEEDDHEVRQRELANDMHQRWLNFMKSHDPNQENVNLNVLWPKYTKEHKKALIFGGQTVESVIPQKADIEFMQGLMFDGEPYYK